MAQSSTCPKCDLVGYGSRAMRSLFKKDNDDDHERMNFGDASHDHREYDDGRRGYDDGRRGYDDGRREYDDGRRNDGYVYVHDHDTAESLW